MSLVWTPKKIAELLNLSGSDSETPLNQITTDSRAVKPGDVFVAIKGDLFDGHAFIDAAIKAGAAAILSETEFSHPTVPVFKVPSTLNAIRTLAHAYRKTFSIPLIGVVGAVGKTTTKELIGSVLNGKFKSVLKTEGSQNGFLGIPLTLLELKPQTEIGIIEIGIDEIGAMDQHLDLVRPTHLILTRTGPEHLHQLKTVEIAAEEELKAFDYALKRSIPLAINLSDPFVASWVQKNLTALKSIPHHTYSLQVSDTPEIQGSFHSETGVLTVSRGKESVPFYCPLPGEHHAHNLLAALTVATFFEMTPDQIKTGLSGFKTAYGRTEIHHLPENIEVIGDYYNSNPTSLEAALKLLIESKATTHFHAALGDMLELGEGEEQFHREIAPLLKKFGIQHVWLYGPRMKWLQNELEKTGFKSSSHYESQEALAIQLKASLTPGARVLIKGSRGMKMEKVLSALQSPGKNP